MEVGGEAPFIVCEVADLGRAIDGVLVCKYRCTGQTCVWCELSTLGWALAFKLMQYQKHELEVSKNRSQERGKSSWKSRAYGD